MDARAVDGPLQHDLAAAVRHLGTLPAVDPSRIVLVGHSTGAGAVVAYAVEHPEIRATVAVSIVSAESLPSDPARPRNLLLIVGGAEFPGFQRAALAALRRSGPTVSFGETTGDPADGTARRAVRVADRRTFVVLGDGELQEGSVWEGAMAAASQGLDRLTVVVDRNGLQITGETEHVVALEPLAERWAAFGWEVRETDGHDREALREALGKPGQGRPVVVIAHTVKGRGLPFVEGQTRSHFAKLSERQAGRAMRALHQGEPS
jgi:pimeloyl-ACP methyl ester carboxylesterase